MRKGKNLSCILSLLILLSIGMIANSQTGIFPTGTDTTCTNGISYYQKIYGGPKNDFASHAAPSADSGYVIAGYTNSYGNGGYDGLLLKIDKRGNRKWSKAIGGTGDDIFYSIRSTADNGFIASGQTKSYGNTAGDVWLVKADGLGNVQWSKKYGDGNANGDIALDVIQLSDGGYAFSGVHRFAGGTAESFVTRIDDQGNVLWSKQYGIAQSDDAGGLLEDGGSLVVVGFYQGSSLYDGYVMKLDKANGAMQWVKGYDAENRGTWMYKINKTNTGYQVFSVLTDDYFGLNQQECIWNLGTDGTVQNVKKLSIPNTWTISTGLSTLADGGFVAINGENNNGSDAIFCRVNADGSLGWSKKFARSGKQQFVTVLPSPEGGYTGFGINSNSPANVDSNDLYVLRVDSLGDAGDCSGTPTTDLVVITPAYTLPVPSIAALGDVTINPPAITPVVTDFIPATQSLCFYCHPLPTGTVVRPAVEELGRHTLEVYPNPVLGNNLTISIQAAYDDEAVISIVDLFGNTIYMTGQKEIRKGSNVIHLNAVYKLRAYSNYFIRVKYKSFTSSAKIFVITP
jgi:hypothetical protein